MCRTFTFGPPLAASSSIACSSALGSPRSHSTTAAATAAALSPKSRSYHEKILLSHSVCAARSTRQLSAVSRKPSAASRSSSRTASAVSP